MRRKIRTREPLYIFVELDINNERDSLVAICAVLLQEWMSFYNKESCAVRNNLASVISCRLACSCPAQTKTLQDEIITKDSDLPGRMECRERNGGTYLTGRLGIAVKAGYSATAVEIRQRDGWQNWIINARLAR